MDKKAFLLEDKVVKDDRAHDHLSHVLLLQVLDGGVQHSKPGTEMEMIRNRCCRTHDHLSHVFLLQVLDGGVQHSNLGQRWK